MLRAAAQVDVIYALSQAWCTSHSDSDFQLLVKYIMDLKPEERILVRGRARQRAKARVGSRASIGSAGTTSGPAAWPTYLRPFMQRRAPAQAEGGAELMGGT